MLYNYYRLNWTVVAVFLPFLIYGQNQALYFHHLQSENGLSHPFNAHIAMDSHGFLWASSENGINRFDGKEVNVFYPELNGKKIDPNINSTIFEDKAKNIWFTSSTALHCINNQDAKQQSWQLENTAANSYYYAFHLENDSLLWLMVDGMVYTFDIHTEEQQELFEFNSFISHVLTTKQGQVSQIVGPLIESNTTNSGFERIHVKNYNDIHRDSFFHINNTLGLPPLSIMYFYVENDTSYWIPTKEEGLLHFNPDRPLEYKKYTDSFDYYKNAYKAIAEFDDNQLIIGTLQGNILSFDTKTKSFSDLGSIPTKAQTNQLINIHTFYVDPFDNLWVATYYEGIFYASLKHRKSSVIWNTPSTSVNSIKFAEDSQQNIFTLGLDNSIKVKRKSSLETLDITINDTSKSVINDIVIDQSDVLWLLKKNSIWSLDLNTNRTKHRFSSTSGNLVFFEQLPNGNFLVSTRDEVHLVRPEKKHHTHSESKIKDLEHAAAIFYEPSHNLLFVDQSDYSQLVYSYKEINGKDSLELVNHIKSIGTLNGVFASNLCDSTVWLATSVGLFNYNPNRFALDSMRVMDNKELLNTSLSDVIEDKNGQLWLSSYKGIFRFNPINREISHYTESDGLPSLEFNPNSSLLTESGIMYFGSNSGVAMIDPDKVIENTTAPLIQLTSLLVNDEQDSLIQNPLNFNNRSFPHDKNTLSFQFSAIEYSDASQNQFRFYLDGSKKDTIFKGTQGFIRYGNLDPNDYTLNILACNSDGFWTPTPKKIHFTIDPPFWKTWWFRLILFLIFVRFLYELYKSRIQKIQAEALALRKEAKYKQQEAEFKQQEAEIRQQAAEFQKQEAELKQQAAEFQQQVAETQNAVLRLQMNPHYIFNAMNSIESLIIGNKPEKASHCLHQFARSMRMTLDFSDERIISLDEEIEFTKLYLETEQLRFDNRFAYEFVFVNDLDLDEYLIPPMLLQPFVENAIKHGIAKKKEHGLIKISFEEKNNLLYCIIQDNGQGRAAAKKEKQTTHKSKAIHITRKRLQILFPEKDHFDFFTIHDLTDAQHKPCGTVVELRLPLFD